MSWFLRNGARNRQALYLSWNFLSTSGKQSSWEWGLAGFEFGEQKRLYFLRSLPQLISNSAGFLERFCLTCSPELRSDVSARGPWMGIAQLVAVRGRHDVFDV